MPVKLTKHDLIEKLIEGPLLRKFLMLYSLVVSEKRDFLLFGKNLLK